MYKQTLFLCMACAILSGCQHVVMDDAAPTQAWFEGATIEQLNEFIVANTNHSLAYYERGKRCADLKRYDEVLADSLVCIERCPTL